RRDNALQNIELMLDHDADFSVVTKKDGISAFALAARRGRGDVLQLLISRGIELKLEGVDQLIAACALGDEAGVRSLIAQEPTLQNELISQGGKLLAEFAGTANAQGITLLLDLGVDVNGRYQGE